MNEQTITNIGDCLVSGRNSSTTTAVSADVKLAIAAAFIDRPLTEPVQKGAFAFETMAYLSLDGGGTTVSDAY